MSSDASDEKKSSRGGIGGWMSNRGLIAKVSFAFFGTIFILIIIVGAGTTYFQTSTTPPETTTTTPPETTTTTPPETTTTTPPASGNNPPIANNQSVITAENKSTEITLTANDKDMNDNLTGQIVIPPLNGSLSSINQNTGVVTYIPNAGFTGIDQFIFKVDDGKEGGTSNGTVRIEVNNNSTN